MITSVYLSNNTVCVVLGTGSSKRARVNRAWHLTLKEGGLINGIVTDEEKLKSQLKRFWMENGIPRKNVRLVLESSRLISRQVELPKMKKKQLRQLLPGEFTDIEQQQEILYEYVLVPGEAGKPRVKAVAAERQYVETFLRIFREMEIVLKSITVGRNVLVQMLETMKGIRGRELVFQVLDGDMMTSLLCSGGRVVYYTQKRIFAEEPKEYAGEILRSVNRLWQFQMTRQKERPITKVFLAGVSEETAAACRERSGELNGTIELSALSLEKNIRFPKCPGEVGGYLFAVGGLMAKKDGINLAKAARRRAQEKKDASRFWGMARLPLILLAGLSLIWGALVFRNQLRQQELEELQGFLQGEENVALAGQAEAMEEESRELEKKIASVEAMNESLRSYPGMNRDTEQALRDCAGEGVEFEINGYDGDRGVLELDGSAKEVSSISGFVDRMQELDILEAVDYSGYEYDFGKESYRFQVECKLAGGEAEE